MRSKVILIGGIIALAYVIGVRIGRSSAQPEPLRLQAERVFRHRRRRRARARAATRARKAARAIARRH